MPPSTSHFRWYVVVFTILCILALAIVLIDQFWSTVWSKAIVTTGQSLGRLFFASAVSAFIIVEVTAMLADWIKETREKKRKQWETDRLNEYEEANNQREDGETLQQAVERIRKEKAGKG